MSGDINTRIFLKKCDKITEFENNLVTLTLESGKGFEGLEPRRLFPVNKTDNYISLLDKSGKEIAVVRELTDLDSKSREVLKQSLDNYYLVPYIQEIFSITQKSGTFVWRVSTNRGDKEFEVRDRNHDIKVYKNGKIRVRDSDDNRYVIEDYTKLDRHSIRQLASDI